MVDRSMFVLSVPARFFHSLPTVVTLTFWVALSACSGGSEETDGGGDGDGDGDESVGDGDGDEAIPPTPPVEFECGSALVCNTMTEYCLAVWDGGPSPDGHSCREINQWCDELPLEEVCACLIEREDGLTDCVVEPDTTIHARYDR